MYIWGLYFCKDEETWNMLWKAAKDGQIWSLTVRKAGQKPSDDTFFGSEMVQFNENGEVNNT